MMLKPGFADVWLGALCAVLIAYTATGSAVSLLKDPATGCHIRTGDYILGDRDGVVVIPQEIAAEAITKTEEVALTENKVRDAIRGGMDPVEAYLKYGKF